METETEMEMEVEEKICHCWRILEFYSGIGGMRYSLLRAGIRGRVVEAFDINNIANDVYEHNFGHRPFQAKRKPLSFRNPSCNNLILWTPSPFMPSKNNQSTDGSDGNDGNQEEFNSSCEPIINFLETRFLTGNQQEYTTFRFGTEVVSSTADGKYTIDKISTSRFLRLLEYCYLCPFLYQDKDIVFPESRRCCCFTKSYYRYVKGTGSLLATSGVSTLLSFCFLPFGICITV
ncbi:hypothetical protein BHE74_00044475 [Ensete ventricosum]|uniref:Uncharacterized protein n=1 Tax=Ensete ventricosum TaxID=4639 RepID=A0A426ZCW8_ENSVE|nr:hypothetical protein B296_00043903 [Ensete ventricosum]RWW49378.1 hypothetical protein BHE74_00044475 [Ensete ventricosum]RZS17745.1 hypothetical protein BHM03_00049936 [Ensete ventricosum]